MKERVLVVSNTTHPVAPNEDYTEKLKDKDWETEANVLKAHKYGHAENEIVFIEANPNSMLAEEEDFAESASKAGMPYPELVQRILNLGKSRHLG